jgi:hypothetical protein
VVQAAGFVGEARLVETGLAKYPFSMSTVAEIEAAIEKLPAEELEKLTDWMEERKALLAAADSIFVMLDEEERRVRL